MSKFIELTLLDGERMAVNSNQIIAVYNANETNQCFDQNGFPDHRHSATLNIGSDEPLLVRDTYESILKKLSRPAK